jgi:hypothetical protein
LLERDSQRAHDEHGAGGNSVDAIGIENPPHAWRGVSSCSLRIRYESERRAVMQEGEES